MLNAFLIAFRLKNTYRANGVIHTLKAAPLIKRLLPGTLYASRGLKTFANVLAGLWEFISVFLGKFLYFGLMFVLPLGWMGRQDAFIHVLLFLTAIGAFFNTKMFDPSRDKYYAMFLMRMDARLYTLTDYGYFLLKTLVGFVPAALLFGLPAGLSVADCLLIPAMVTEVKCISAAVGLATSEKKGKTVNENKLLVPIFVGAAVLLAAAYLPPYLGWFFPHAALYPVCAVTTVLAGLSAAHLLRFKEYRRVYKDLFSDDTFVQVTDTSTAQTMQNATLSKIEVTAEQTSAKSGCAYLNDLFVKRHRKILVRSARRITLVFAIFFAAATAACLLLPEAQAEVNGLLLTFLPYFLFVMYFINRGKGITQAMFMNCDHSMLTYRFYRQPKVILPLFAARLRSIIYINLLPAAVIAVGLPLLLAVTGGTDNPLNYLVLFVSIIAMSVFFSVHNLVLYYLLQPYNAGLESKSAAYSVINSVTYLVCYIAIGKEAPTLVFGTAVTAFCLIYVAVALVLAYRLAPRTFKLR